MRLITAFIPVLEYLTSLKPQLIEESTKSIAEVKQELEPLLVKSEELTCPNEDFDNALFAVCALIDETILDSSWQHKEEWAKQSLQIEKFSTNLAGTQFYQRLDDLSESAAADLQIREVYLYTLCQGFVGCYFDAGSESIRNQIIQSNYLLLKNAITIDLFSPIIPSLPAVEPPEVAVAKFKDGFYTLAPITLVVLVYLFMRNDVLDAITALLARL